MKKTRGNKYDKKLMMMDREGALAVANQGSPAKRTRKKKAASK